MLYTNANLIRSTVLSVPGVVHAFSTRLGGVSALPHTREMNIAEGHGDSAETVRQNIDILVSEMSGGTLTAADAVVTHQIHSAKIRVLTDANRGEGVNVPAGEPCDGFVTDCPGVVPVVRTADCVPVLLCGAKADGAPVVSAVHAGWRGTAAGIVCEAVGAMLSLGAQLHTVRAAIGPHIGMCCFEVGEDMKKAVGEMRGREFARRHVRFESGHLRADLSSMNKELLIMSGVKPEHIDISNECTCCNTEKFHSHRATHGIRGAMGSCIAVL